MLPLRLTAEQWVHVLHGRTGHQSIRRIIETMLCGADIGTTLTPALRKAFQNFSNKKCDICAACRFKRNSKMPRETREQIEAADKEIVEKRSLGPYFLAAKTLDKGERGRPLPSQAPR